MATPKIIVTQIVNSRYFGDHTPKVDRYIYEVDKMYNTLVVFRGERITKSAVQDFIDKGINVEIR